MLERIRAEGPLGSRDFEGSGGGGDMWNWKPAKMVLEALWDSGQLVIAGRRSFQRLYDLAERVIPKHILEAPPPPEDETLRTFALLAVRARGALTEAAIREHWRLKGGKARLHHHLLALVDEGQLREVQVDDGGAPFYVDAEHDLDGAAAPPVLVSPFDNIVWDRPLLERVFGFRHVIEVYKREHERAYGYYVLPLLVGDRFVGRADLKADRAEGVLHVKRFTPEPRARGKLHDKLERAARRLARTTRTGARCDLREVSVEEARRIAVRAQLLDGSATDVLSTVRHLGFLQLDPISSSPRHSTSCSGAG